jgi:DNA-binding transcriptional MerR regulator
VTKGPLALRTISETAELVGVQQHVLRFWETKFPFIRPTKRAGGRRFYRPQDVDLLIGVKTLLYDRGYTIRGVQKLHKDEGQKAILNPDSRHYGGGDGDDDTPHDGQEGTQGFDADRVAALSAQTRERFLNIAKALEEAQEHLWRHLGRVGRVPRGGNYS